MLKLIVLLMVAGLVVGLLSRHRASAARRYMDLRDADVRIATEWQWSIDRNDRHEP